MGRLGILGGTFNPPHLGHLVCAQEAHWQLRLDVVLLIPVAAPPHKDNADDPGPRHRVEMCRLAADGDERLAVSGLEVDRDGPSYTVDTLRALHAGQPRDELTFIVGGDMARTLPAWREPEAILELATVAVAQREGAARDDIRLALAPLDAGERVVFFDMPRIDVSSSLVRRRRAQRLPVRYLVPDPVAGYIEARDLYAAETGAGAGRPAT